MTMRLPQLECLSSRKKEVQALDLALLQAVQALLPQVQLLLQRCRAQAAARINGRAHGHDLARAPGDATLVGAMTATVIATATVTESESAAARESGIASARRIKTETESESGIATGTGTGSEDDAAEAAVTAAAGGELEATTPHR